LSLLHVFVLGILQQPFNTVSVWLFLPFPCFAIFFDVLIVLMVADDKCTKHQFIHLLTATFKDLHIENSKNHKRRYCSHHTDCVSMSVGVQADVWCSFIWTVGHTYPIYVTRYLLSG